MEVYVADFSYGKGSIVKVPVRETPKTYVKVAEHETILGESYFFKTVINKQYDAVFLTELEAFEFLLERVTKARIIAFEKAVAADETYKMLTEIVAHKKKEA